MGCQKWLRLCVPIIFTYFGQPGWCDKPLANNFPFVEIEFTISRDLYEFICFDQIVTKTKDDVWIFV